jgi:hypothetical protein
VRRVGRLGRDRRARGARAHAVRVDVLDVEVHLAVHVRQLRRAREPDLRVRRREHQHVAAVAELGVADPPVRHLEPVELLEAERLAQERDRGRGVVVGEVGNDRLGRAGSRHRESSSGW